MKLNYINRGLIIILAVIVLGGVIFAVTKLNSSEKRTDSMNWTNQQATFDEVYKNADSVIIGKVNDLELYDDPMTIFTMAKVETIEVLKGNAEAFCNVLFTGGTVNGVIYKSEECIIPSKDGTYLFLLKAREIEGEYIPIGGYQGIFELDVEQNKSASQDTKIKPFNENNKIEKDVVNKAIKDVVNGK